MPSPRNLLSNHIHTQNPHMPKVTHSVEHHIGTIVFDQTAKFNAMTLDMWRGLVISMQALVDDPTVRVVVLQGAGDKAFISGADISQFGAERSGAAQYAYDEAVEAAYACVVNCPKPTIAKIQGICMGGGLGLALYADIRIGADDARMRMPAARLSVGYRYDGIARMVEVLGAANAADLFFSARIVRAEEAHQMGFFKEVVAKAALDQVVQAYAAQIAENAPLSIAAAKRAMIELRQTERARDLSAVQTMVDACFTSADYVEGREAFMTKRAPQFRGY